TNGLGRTLTLSYTSGKLTSVSDETSRSVSYSLDGDSNLTTFTDTLSNSTTYAYDQPGRMTQIFLPAAPTTAVVTNTYDSLGRVQTQKDANLNTWTYYFAGSRSEEVDPNGNGHAYYFNKSGSPLRSINQLGFETEMVYDGLNRLTQVTIPEGNQVQYSYDDNNNILSITRVPKPGSGLSNIVNTMTYDSTWNKIHTLVDGNDNTWTWNYDGTTGNLLNVQKPEVDSETPENSFTWNSRGQIETATDATGIVTQFNYDSSTEKLTSVVADYGTSSHLNLTTNFVYDTVGNLTSIQDPNGNTTSFEFDSERRVTQKTDPTPFSYVMNTVYDVNGNVTSVSRQTGGSPAWQTYSFAYYVTDKLHTVTDPLSAVTTYEYDNMNRPLHITDAEDRVTTFAYDEVSRLNSITDPLDNVALSRTFTDNGLLYQETDARGKTKTHEMDGFDRPIMVTYADSSTEQWTSYDDNGNVLTFVSRSGATVTNTFDALNRLSTKTPSGQATVSYSYDLAGRILQISTPVVSGNPATGVFAFAYDSAGRLASETTPDSKVMQYLLDNNGNVNKITHPDSYYVTYVFDELNRLTDIKLNGSSSSALQFGYDELSRRTSLTYGNGATVSYDYQLNDDLSSLEHQFNGTDSITFGFTFNDVHQETGRSFSDGSYLWRPGASHSTTYGTANDVNQYPTVDSVSYSYNDNGCLTSDGTWTFGYDTENHLISASKTGISASYVYDGMHRQIQKTVGSTKTRYVYAGSKRILDYDGSGSLETRYIFGPGMDEPLIAITSGGTITYLHSDRQGSIIAETNTSGAVTGPFKYSAFGESASVPASGFGFTGQRYDSETGLYYWKARYMSPALGRFLQPDPIRSNNDYPYVDNDPLNTLDSTGLSPWLPGGDLIGGGLPGGDLTNGLPLGDLFGGIGLSPLAVEPPEVKIVVVSGGAKPGGGGGGGGGTGTPQPGSPADYLNQEKALKEKVFARARLAFDIASGLTGVGEIAAGIVFE
ncbi:MAG: RHS repeat-associated core domain-containing protein, partial [bacterium]